MYKITLIPGDGIGPEITAAAKTVIEATGIDIEWDVQQAGEAGIAKHGNPFSEEVIESLHRNKIALKGPLTTPIASGFRSISTALRRELDLYINFCPILSYKGIKSRYEDIDLVVIRENTEDLYAGIEHMVGKDAAESIRIVTRKGSERILRYAFEYAKRNDRKMVTAVHKADIMKCTDGLFLEAARQIAGEYPEIEFDDCIMDSMSMQLVRKPELYDVLVMPNLYGGILGDLGAGLVGGLGVVPMANIGDKIAVFEPIHGTAPKYAGQSRANPMAMILSGVLMLEYLGEFDVAEKTKKALQEVLMEGKTLTQDLGGTATTSEFGDAVASKL